MIPGPSTRDPKVTKPDFRPCSACMPHSQAPLCLCTLRLVSNQPEGTFGRLRYTLGGDRPSQTTHLAMSLSSIQKTRLDFQNDKGGISPSTPPRLTPGVQSLPPILHRPHRKPLLGCS